MNVKTFEKKCNFSTGLIHRAVKNQSSLGSDKLIAIAKLFPSLNMDWLLTGEGTMIEDNFSLSSIKTDEMISDQNVNYSTKQDTVYVLTQSVLKMTENENLIAKSVLKMTENDSVRAENETKLLQIHEKLINLLEKEKR